MLTRPLLLLLLALFVDPTAAFSSSAPGGPASSNDTPEPELEAVSRNFIEITNFGVGESLPSSFIERWPNWFLESDGTVHKIPDEDGFVNPTSVEQLYQPIDLKRPEMKLALGLHVRSGQIRHVMPSLDVSYSNGQHRNRGLCSLPLAYTWVDFGYFNSLSDYSRYEFRVSSKTHVPANEPEEPFTKLFDLPGTMITKAVEKAIMCLAETDCEDLGSGSHILHVALEGSQIEEIPKTKNILQATLVELAADAGEQDLNIGILEVAVVTTMSGSESEYLPDAYKPLFEDESLRNPLYAKFQKRKQERAAEEAKKEL